jgi:hypothetical protein
MMPALATLREVAMATRERLRLDVEHKGRREDTINEVVNPEDEGALRDILHAWLDSNGWRDPARWHEFTISFPGGFGRTEVQG